MWAPRLVPGAVVLDAVPADRGLGRPVDPAALGDILADQLLGDGRHVVVRDAGGPHRLWLRDPTPGRPLTMQIAPDSHYPLRSGAATRLWRRLSGLPAGPPPPGSRPTNFQRRRMVLLLDLTDASLAGAGSREIAMHLVYPRLPQLSAAEWKDSAERQRTRRLVKEALDLMRGGYRALLCGP